MHDPGGYPSAESNRLPAILDACAASLLQVKRHCKTKRSRDFRRYLEPSAILASQGTIIRWRRRCLTSEAPS